MQHDTNIGLISAVKIAKKLAEAIDELRKFKINISKINLKYCAFFPEHIKKRLEFLLIFFENWFEILNKLEKNDIEIEYNNYLFENQTDCIQQAGVSLFQAEDLLQEIDFIMSVIIENEDKTISIIALNKQLYELLLIRLGLENIEYSSYIEHFDRKSKYLIEFINEIEKNFGDFGEISKNDFDNLVKELLEFYPQQKQEKRKVSLIKITDIPSFTPEIVIASSMNEGQWNMRHPGEYWLPRIVRSYLCLPIENFQKITENYFYSIFNKNSKIFLTRAKKSGTTISQKSSILAKFEARCKIKNIKIESKFLNNFYTKSEIKQSDNFHKNFVIPTELSSSSVELLESNPYIFFAREILNIYPENCDKFIANLSQLFKKFLYSFYTNNNKIQDILEQVKEIDPFYYQKFKSVLEWLNINEKNQYISDFFYNVHGKIAFPIFFSEKENYFVDISAFFDKITVHGSYAIMHFHKFLYEVKNRVLTAALVAEHGQLSEIIPPIREARILSLTTNAANWYAPTEIKTIEISKKMIDDHKEHIMNLLEEYFVKKDLEFYEKSKQIFNKYKHFERR
ncbi:hypothetical protein FACS1894113_0340 [Alphaproteobacteria bacterium]|nr:hypothetical protein FACS1894113_0340 [Alphaproteobacteria bacterium]